eukprot:XP_001689593.1 protein with potential galactosyl transferase activity [Chlamydomonas reinhardtii]
MNKSPSGRARAATAADAHDINSLRSFGRVTCSRCSHYTVTSVIVALACVTALVMSLRVGHAVWRASPRRPSDCTVPWTTAEPAATVAAGGSASPSGATSLSGNHKLRIALVSMSTGRAQPEPQKQTQQRGQAGAAAGGVGGTALNFRAAEFSDLLDLTGPVFAEYAALHGYTYADASGLMDASRPASWSKILAVLSALDAYDWVMWVDADILITNTSMPLERLLPAAAAGDPLNQPSGPDFILTEDAAGVNAGVWLMRGRGCAWCRSFLARWWSLSGFIRTDAASGKSGDNDALKHMIATMDPDELAAHVGFAPQCAFNSYLWRSSPRTWGRWLARPYTMQGALLPPQPPMHVSRHRSKSSSSAPIYPHMPDHFVADC